MYILFTSSRYIISSCLHIINTILPSIIPSFQSKWPPTYLVVCHLKRYHMKMSLYHKTYGRGPVHPWATNCGFLPAVCGRGRQPGPHAVHSRSAGFTRCKVRLHRVGVEGPCRAGRLIRSRRMPPTVVPRWTRLVIILRWISHAVMAYKTAEINQSLAYLKYINIYLKISKFCDFLRS